MGHKKYFLSLIFYLIFKPKETCVIAWNLNQGQCLDEKINTMPEKNLTKPEFQRELCQELPFDPTQN